MAFTLQNWGRVFVTANTACPGVWSYQGGADALATIAAANYFSEIAYEVQVGDLIYVVGSDADEFLTVTAVNTAVNPNTITTSAFSTAGTIGTSNITNNAVTAPKLATSTAYGFFANPTGSTANQEQVNIDNATLVFSGTTLEVATGGITATQIASGTITTTQISASAAITGSQLATNTIETTQLGLDVLQKVTGTLSAANINAMYATPVAISSMAATAGKMWVIDKALLNYIYSVTAFTGTGNIGIQYGATVHLGGPAATGVVSGTGFTDQTANMAATIGGSLAANLTSSLINTEMYFSASSAFSLGAGSIAYTIWCKLVAAS